MTQCQKPPSVDEKTVELMRQKLLANFLQAMREDLSEWICSLSFNAYVTPDNFLPSLDNGVTLCQQARLIHRYAEEYAVTNQDVNLKIPAKPVYYTDKGAYSGSFVSRDNVANYIAWCRELGIPDVVLFESEDLVLHKNEKSVILTLIDVARKACKFGVQPPEIVRFEKEIDEEIERDKENEKRGRPMAKPRDLEEDNNLDTMVRNIVNKCTCHNRFPIKKLSEGKYKVGRNDTLIFVRIMRKHVMVRIGGGWDTLDHYIVKHDPCRTKVSGNIDSSGQNVTPLKPSNAPQQKVNSKAKEKRNSHISSDTWSMGSASTNSSASLEEDCLCPKLSPRKPQVVAANIENDLTLSMDRSIHEIDMKLQQLENQRGSGVNALPKDTSVYENKADSWLRSQMNILKERTNEAENPRDEFAMRRGYTADVVLRKKRSQKTDPRRHSQVRLRSKSGAKFDTLSTSYERGLEEYGRISAGSSNVSICSNTSDMCTQTDNSFVRTQYMGQSRIPRPTMQRSRTADAILRKSVGIPRLRKRVLASNDSPRLSREKSDLVGRPTPRRQKSDLTGRSTKRRSSSKALLKPDLKSTKDKKTAMTQFRTSAV